MEPGRAVVRETEPDFEGDLNKAAAAGEQQQTELITLHLLHLARCRHVFCEKKLHHFTTSYKTKNTRNDLWMIGGAYFSPKACDIFIPVRLRPIVLYIRTCW